MTHVTEFCDTINSSSSPLDSNVTGLELLFSDEDLVFEFRDHISPISVVELDTSIQVTAHD